MIKILLVEDDKIIVASLSEYLNSEGYLVRSVSGQAEAMKLLAEEKADLVLLDVSLAEGNGFAACSVPFPVSWTVKMKKKQKETQDILSYHSQAAGCSDKARAKASGGRQPIEECGRTGL